jgi:hypothetical protein
MTGSAWPIEQAPCGQESLVGSPPDMPPDLTTFAGNLSWKPALLECCRSWLDACRALLDRKLRAHCEQNAKLSWLLSAYLGLSEDSRTEFLLSPRVSNQLLSRDAGHVPTFAALAPDFVRVLARSSANAATDPDLAGLLDAFGRDNGEVRGIAVDFDSTITFPSRGPNSGELRILQPGRAVQARQRLDVVLGALEQGNPIAFDWVRLLTRRLAVREEEGRAADSASCIFGHLIGLTLLTNPWVERVDTADLVDSLVHESIHAGLFFYEAVQGALFLHKTCPEPICSPWTGKQLTCDQFVQACFVWFGLAHLWGNWPTGVGGVSGERATQLHRRAYRGFLARPVEALLSHTGSRPVPPLLQDALSLLEQNALDAWGERQE